MENPKRVCQRLRQRIFAPSLADHVDGDIAPVKSDLSYNRDLLIQPFAGKVEH
jgi:hypothetical protein